MKPTPSAPADSSLAVKAWRDYDARTLAVPGMCLEEAEAGGPPEEAVDRLWKQGARRVELPGTVDPTDTTDAARTVQKLCLIRDLTAQAVYTQWRLRLAPATGAGSTEAAGEELWKLFSHLQPPAVVEGPTDGEGLIQRWRAGHYVGKCVWRRGPGFLQVRDRRWGELRRFTVSEDAFQRAIEVLVPGAPASEVPEAVLKAFLTESLVHRVGDQVWWMPYRARRWAQAPMMI
ncbi:DUF5825 family protein [Streptomyces sp. ACA25]|uniref:DUF5825 family protein n=1 Tax=Streptomyces sp. ACA25 TaxID=3022596 RepID=UPI0023078723|nr:DUF5825 family protein [Streptomyces sp. ACA25]MDB1089971.1 DUF5825 family protein [Streptomyces sp. ACA25]